MIDIRHLPRYELQAICKAQREEYLEALSYSKHDPLAVLIALENVGVL